MRHYEHLASYDREGFEIIVDKTWEDIDVADCFDDTCYDVQELRDKINSYQLDWFMLRVRAMHKGHELGVAYVGGCLYEDPREVLTDGLAEDLIWEALEQARKEARELAGSLQQLVDTAAA